MMFFLILAVAAILMAGVLYLPYAAGLTTLEVEKKNKNKAEPQQQVEDDDFGYVPPDVAAARANSSSVKSHASLKERFASQDIPVKIKLDSSNTLRRRTKERLDVDSNPNNYDYDIDELIREEALEAAQEQMRQDYKGQLLGKDKEAMV